MLVPDRLSLGADHDAVLDHFASRGAQVVMLQIGPLDARYLRLCGGGRALSRAGHIELLCLVSRAREGSHRSAPHDARRAAGDYRTDAGNLHLLASAGSDGLWTQAVLAPSSRPRFASGLHIVKGLRIPRARPRARAASGKDARAQGFSLTRLPTVRNHAGLCKRVLPRAQRFHSGRPWSGLSARGRLDEAGVVGGDYRLDAVAQSEFAQH